jgi:hypothetical protein
MVWNETGTNDSTRRTPDLATGGGVNALIFVGFLSLAA